MSLVSPCASCVVGASTEGAPSGSIRWEIDTASVSTVNNFTPPREVGGIMWAIAVRKSQTVPDQLAVFLYQIDGDYEVRSVDVKSEIKLLNCEDDAKTFTMKVNRTYVGDKVNWGFADFFTWSEAIDESKGFIKDGKLTVQCDFSLSNIRGYSKLRIVDFTDPKEPSHDVVFVIDGVKIYVNKGVLSVLSPVFQAMFYGGFAEKKKKEIELKDIDYKEFMELLGIIYPPHSKITGGNFECILKLADRFEIHTVNKLVEEFLIRSTTPSVSAKLILADRYRLHKLVDHCLNELKTTKDVKDLKNSCCYKNLPAAIKLELFDKIMSLND